MANTWPSIAVNAFPMDSAHEDGVLRTTFENGVEQARNKFTHTRKGWVLRWPAMSDTDRDTLATFFWTTLSAGALSFSWTNPQTSESGTYRFAGPPRESLNNPNRWNIEVTIREV